MYQWRLLRLVLLPSIPSGTVALVSALVFLGYAGWQYIQQEQFFYEYLFSAEGLHSYFWQEPIQTPEAVHNALGGTPAYALTILIIALIGGTICFAILEGIRIFKERTDALLEDITFNPTGKSEIVAEVVTRICLRIMIVLGWSLYVLFFITSVTPFCVVLTETGITHFEGSWLVGSALCGLALAFFSLCLHLHVSFLRMTLMRPRIFHRDAYVEEVELETYHRPLA